MMADEYLLKPAILGRTPEITITEQEYVDAKRCHKQVFEAFEIELAFDFVVKNYVEIEKFIAEHLVLDMTGQTRTVDAFRLQQWDFMRTLNNWLASISFWWNLMRNRLIRICGRGSEIKVFEDAHKKLMNNEFVYAFLFHLRNYSQHGGFPITEGSTGSSWDKDFKGFSYSASYTLDYNNIRSYFEKGGRGVEARKAFGKKIEAYNQGKPFDLKPIIRQSLGFFGQFMDDVRMAMETSVRANEDFVLDLIERYTSAHPSVSIIGLAVMPVDQNKVVKNKADIISVRDEFISRAREMRKKNNGKTLESMEKRIISNR